MEKSIALIGIPGSRFTDEVAAHLGDSRISRHILSMDAPLEGKPVTTAAGTLVWEGVELTQCEAIFIERSIFSWPQTRIPPEGLDLSYKQWSVFQREAAALSISALLVAGDRVPVVNPPKAAQMAASPSIALDRLVGRGLPVNRWELGPAPPREGSGGGIVLDSCGRERWHNPGRPGEGGHALILEPFQGEAVVFLVVGGRCVGALRFPDGESWARWCDSSDVGETARPELVADPESLPGAADLARRTAEALGLGFAAVSIGSGSARPSVLLCEVSPDLAAWDGLLEGCAAAAMAEHLVSIVPTG